MPPASRLSVLQQLQASGGNIPANQALLMAYQQLQQQQQQQQQGGVNMASAGMQGSPYMANTQPTSMSQQQQQQQLMMSGASRMAASNAAQAVATSQQQLQSNTPQLAPSTIAAPAAIQQQHDSSVAATTAAATQYQQQRVFAGTNIPMPLEIAAEIDRQLNTYRMQFGATSSTADLSALQQSMEQQMLGRYINSQQQQQQQMQQAMRPPPPSQPQPQPQLLLPQQQQQQQPGMVNPAVTANFTQHMALVSALTKSHIQVLYNQLRAQVPQLLGTLSFDNFAQLLSAGQLANHQIVNQFLVLLVQGIQQQQRHQQQQMATSGVPARPPMTTVGGMGMSPQMQIQLQNYQRMQMLQQQMAAARPPSNPHHQITSPPPGASTPVSRIGGASTPLQQSRGIKRKSVNNSPAQAPATLPQTKSPLVTSPPPNATTTSESLASVVAKSEPEEAAPAVATTTTTITAAAAVSGVSVAESLDLGSPQPNHPMQSSQPIPPPAMTAASAAMMASLNQMTPAQRQLFAAQQQQQQQQQQNLQLSQMALMQMLPNFQQLPGQMQMSLTHLLAQQRQLQYSFQNYQAAVQSPSITPQQRTVFMSQLSQIQPNLAIISHQLSQQLAYAKSMGGQQPQLLPAGSSAPPPPPPPALAPPGTLTESSQPLVATEPSSSTPLQQQPVPVPPPAAATTTTTTNGSGDSAIGNFFGKDDGGGGTGVVAPSSSSEKADVIKTTATTFSSSSSSSTQLPPPSSSANFYLAPSQPPPPPTVLAADKVSEVLDPAQQAQVRAWQAAADQITRANQFKVRETGIYQAREEQYRRVLDEQRQHNSAMAASMRKESQQLAMSLSSGETTKSPFSLVFPGQRRPPAPGQLATMRWSKRQLRHQAEQTEVLVPIRIDIDADGHRLRDTFTWDLHNELVPPQRFALGLCIDLQLPPETFVPLIVQSIEEQLDDFRLYGHVAAASAQSVRQSLLDEIKNKVDSGDLVWVDDELRVVIRIDIIIGHIALRDQLEWDVAPLLRPPPPPTDALLPEETGSDLENESDAGDGADDGHVPQSPSRDSAARLDEWQAQTIGAWASGAMDGQSVTPEQVARTVCAERGLGGEFETAYAHSAREQLYAFAKSFLLAGYAYQPQLQGGAKQKRRPVLVDDRELARTVLAPITPGATKRPVSTVTTFAPLIAHLHSVDVERLEKDADREVRRKRRQQGAAAGNRVGGRGAARADQRTGSNLAPDREAHRTNRTMIALPSWFADDLPPDTRSFVDVPGEGAHFLDAYDA
ncbi:SWI/SNF chromatin-remodeling complex subunit, partial [Coemansia aciculifera]